MAYLNNTVFMSITIIKNLNNVKKLFNNKHES